MRGQFKELDSMILPQPANETEVFPGIHERRYFIRGSLTTIASLVALGALPKDIEAQTNDATIVTGAEKLAWDDFLKQAVPVAQQIIADPGFNFDEYLYRIGSLATRLKEIPDSKLGPYTDVDP